MPLLISSLDGEKFSTERVNHPIRVCLFLRDAGQSISPLGPSTPCLRRGFSRSPGVMPGGHEVE